MTSKRMRGILIALVVAALTLVILSLRGGGGPFGIFRSAAGSALGGVERVTATLVSPFLAIGEWFDAWGDQKQRIAELEQQNGELRQLVERSAVDRARADELDSLLGVAGLGQYRIIPAEVIAIGPAQEYAWTVTIDAGRTDGVETNMTVISGSGLVGRVASLTRNTATIVLAIDASTAVGARVAGSDEVGILTGTGRQDSMEFQLLDPLADLQSGQALVTFGSRGGRPYAPGVPIGEVVSVSGTAGQLTRVATIRPFVDVSTLHIVGVVVKPPREDPRDSVLPAVPDITPTPAITPSPGATPETSATTTPAPTVEQPASPAAE